VKRYSTNALGALLPAHAQSASFMPGLVGWSWSKKQGETVGHGLNRFVARRRESQLTNKQTTRERPLAAAVRTARLPDTDPLGIRRGQRGMVIHPIQLPLSVWFPVNHEESSRRLCVFNNPARLASFVSAWSVPHNKLAPHGLFNRVDMVPLLAT